MCSLKCIQSVSQFKLATHQTPRNHLCLLTVSSLGSTTLHDFPLKKGLGLARLKMGDMHDTVDINPATLQSIMNVPLYKNQARESRACQPGFALNTWNILVPRKV